MLKSFDPVRMSTGNIYHMMISGIAPRPIALVSSLDENGNRNLAPFSFFNGFSSIPPIVGFSPALAGGDAHPKDTLMNIRETGEFTISSVTRGMAEKMNLTATEFPQEIDEFIESGFTPYSSSIVLPPGVAESPFIMECRLHSIIEFGKVAGSGNLILGEIVKFHVDELFLDDRDRVNPAEMKLIGRMGGRLYTETLGNLFEIK